MQDAWIPSLWGQGKSRTLDSILVELGAWVPAFPPLPAHTYGSLDLGMRVPSSLIRSLMLNRRRRSTGGGGGGGIRLGSPKLPEHPPTPLLIQLSPPGVPLPPKPLSATSVPPKLLVPPTLHPLSPTKGSPNLLHQLQAPRDRPHHPPWFP